MLAHGTRIGNYEVLEMLGDGQAAVTYRARHVGSRVTVALKVPHPGLLSDTEFFFRFCREAALGRRLDHPSIVRVLDSGDEQDLFIAMELVEGTLLSTELAGHGPLLLPRALRVAREVADALGYAHLRGVVHRNLKPGHIMLLPDDRVKVMDFGLARDYGQVGLTSADVRLGSPLYCAPEGKDPRTLDHQSDLYSLGVILFEMLEGKPPFEALSPVELMILHCTAPFPPLHSLEVPVPRGVWDLMERLCRKQPAERPRLATEVVRELDRIIALVGQRG